MAALARSLLSIAIVALLGASACSKKADEREYPLKGQIIAVKSDTRQLTVKHEDIPGLMPAMVMSFEVTDPAEIDRRKAGELITATLVVRDFESRLKDIKVVGQAAVNPAVARHSTTTLLAEGDAIPDAAFVDQDGRARRVAEWRGHPLLVTFIYTRCPLPDFCPRLERNFSDVQKAIDAEPALRGQARLVAVSFDPTYDTPAVLKARAAALGARPDVWTYVTGDLEPIERFAASFGVSIIRNPSDATDITHNLRTAVVAPDGRLRQMFSGSDWTAADAVSALKDAAARR